MYSARTTEWLGGKNWNSMIYALVNIELGSVGKSVFTSPISACVTSGLNL